MKTNNIKYILAAGLVCCGFSTTMTSCSGVLDEQPRSQYDPTFFYSDTGVEGGINALYANLRNIYGNGYYLNICETGTDEYTYAQSADGNFKDADMSDAGRIDPSTSRSDVLWGNAFSSINTANGVLENAAKGNVSASLIGETRCFRAFYYFNLVQTFGGVPLDLGAGELIFNTTTLRLSTRNTVPEVYTKAIFPDLKFALDNLPDNPRLTGAVAKNVARLFLAKAYLTYGWWLQNPKDIPTYPDCARTDPDGHDAAWYFQQAYNIALEGIQNPGSYKLMETFRDVNLGQNDHNMETMLYADHNTNEKYGNGGVGYGWGSGGSPENFAYWMTNWNYTLMKGKAASGGTIDPLQRGTDQALGRPWTRMAAIANNFMEGGAFEDAVKAIDSRYDATFTTRWHANFNIGNAPNEAYVEGANGMQVKPGEVFFSFVDEATAKNIDWSANGAGIGAGSLPGRADFVVGVDNISRFKYPTNWKIGIYRNDVVGLGSHVNGGSPRPFVIAKYSELYLIAAEAAVKGATGAMSARDLVNVLRARAGKWTWSVNDNCAKVEDHSAEMIAATPDVITIDYILDERMREFWGEGYRWFDLVRTQTWAEKAGSYKIAGAGNTDRELQTVTRTITAGHYLRPIPRGQIDGLEMTDAEKVAYQNPAYRN